MITSTTSMSHAFQFAHRFVACLCNEISANIQTSYHHRASLCARSAMCDEARRRGCRSLRALWLALPDGLTIRFDGSRLSDVHMVLFVAAVRALSLCRLNESNRGDCSGDDASTRGAVRARARSERRPSARILRWSLSISICHYLSMSISIYRCPQPKKPIAATLFDVVASMPRQQLATATTTHPLAGRALWLVRSLALVSQHHLPNLPSQCVFRFWSIEFLCFMSLGE
jgi:hypothetical protein